MALSKQDQAKIEDFIKERDEILMACDLDRLISFQAKRGREFSSREVAEITLHEARTAAKSLPIEARLLSKRWLAKRGYTSLDDGDSVN